MKLLKQIWPVVFSLLMLTCVLVTAWQAYASPSVKSQISTVREDLANRQGELRKQQSEYDKASSEIVASRERLEELQPELDVVQARKNERKALRAQYNDLETRLVQIKNPGSAQTVGEDDEDEYEYVEEEDEEEEYVEEDEEDESIG